MVGGAGGGGGGGGGWITGWPDGCWAALSRLME